MAATRAETTGTGATESPAATAAEIAASSLSCDPRSHQVEVSGTLPAEAMEMTSLRDNDRTSVNSTPITPKTDPSFWQNIKTCKIKINILSVGALLVTVLFGASQWIQSRTSQKSYDLDHFQFCVDHPNIPQVLSSKWCESHKYQDLDSFTKRGFSSAPFLKSDTLPTIKILCLELSHWVAKIFPSSFQCRMPIEDILRAHSGNSDDDLRNQPTKASIFLLLIAFFVALLHQLLLRHIQGKETPPPYYYSHGQRKSFEMLGYQKYHCNILSIGYCTVFLVVILALKTYKFDILADYSVKIPCPAIIGSGLALFVPLLGSVRLFRVFVRVLLFQALYFLLYIFVSSCSCFNVNISSDYSRLLWDIRYSFSFTVVMQQLASILPYIITRCLRVRYTLAMDPLVASLAVVVATIYII
ncbi:hypothetical protein BGZ60DRAFT_256987 [Tricladium varicosporioides]|nr:hypothetical protein BGZ60DRAFT_256987 [Hymenoscyphus varicosporioides]